MAMGKKPLFLSVLFLVYLSVLLSQASDIYLKEDSCQYIILSQSIKAGHGYQMLNFPGEPFCEYYPLLWPALLSFFIPAKASAIDMSGILNIILFLGCFFAFKLLFEKYIEDKSLAFWCWMFLIFNPYFLYLKTEFLSEPLFLLLLAALFLSLERYCRKPDYCFIILAGSLTGLCYLTRHIAVVLFLAVFFYLISKNRQFKEASLFGFSFLLFYLPWEIVKTFHTSPFSGNPFGMLGAINPYNPGSGFCAGAGDVIANFLNSSNLLVNDFTLLLIPHSWPGFLRLLLLGILILGVAIRLKKGIKAGDFFAAVYLFGLSFWPYTLEFKRLLLPILPFFLVFVFLGLKEIVRNNRVRNLFLAVFLFSL